jgi:hypothetical protein
MLTMCHNNGFKESIYHKNYYELNGSIYHRTTDLEHVKSVIS